MNEKLLIVCLNVYSIVVIIIYITILILFLVYLTKVFDGSLDDSSINKKWERTLRLYVQDCKDLVEHNDGLICYDFKECSEFKVIKEVTINIRNYDRKEIEKAYEKLNKKANKYISKNAKNDGDVFYFVTTFFCRYLSQYILRYLGYVDSKTNKITFLPINKYHVNTFDNIKGWYYENGCCKIVNLKQDCLVPKILIENQFYWNLMEGEKDD